MPKSSPCPKPFLNSTHTFIPYDPITPNLPSSNSSWVPGLMPQNASCSCVWLMPRQHITGRLWLAAWEKDFPTKLVGKYACLQVSHDCCVPILSEYLFHPRPFLSLSLFFSFFPCTFPFHHHHITSHLSTSPCLQINYTFSICFRSQTVTPSHPPLSSWFTSGMPPPRGIYSCMSSLRCKVPRHPSGQRSRRISAMVLTAMPAGINHISLHLSPLYRLLVF